jgi:hypothetical protein
MRPTLPEPFVAFLMSTVEIDPAKRPQSAGEAARRLAVVVNPRTPGPGVRPAVTTSAVPPAPVQAPAAVPERPAPPPQIPTPVSPRRLEATVVERRRAPGRLPLIVAAALPPSRLLCPEDLRWLREKVVPGGRTLVIGSTFWFAILPVADAAAGEEAAARIRDAILDRYRSMARVAWRMADESLAVQDSAGKGSPLPPEFQELIGRLFG